MQLPFLNRSEEFERLRILWNRRSGTLAVLYGRRRCGKSRLLREVAPAERTVAYVGDDRESPLQRTSLASEIARSIAGFDSVEYPDWQSLLTRWWRDSRPGFILVLDEFPAMVARAPELPSVMQKLLDRNATVRRHFVLAGSSQRMMQGLVLDRSAPLYGRAHEILKIGPLQAGWIRHALKSTNAQQAVENFAIWGGVPRYWELAADYRNLEEAVRGLVLSPLGVLHEEPAGLLLDDLRDTAQATSILSLIGRGCHRASEIAGRLEKPATSLSRPLQRLVDLDLVQRETPFGTSVRDTKRTAYRIADPFLRFWFRFVEPNRSRLASRRLGPVQRDVQSSLVHHVASIWEDLARASVPLLSGAQTWGRASRWWGPGLDRRPMEVDVVAESKDRRTILLGEVEWSEKANIDSVVRELQRKAENLPIVEGRKVHLAIWCKSKRRRLKGVQILGPDDVLGALR